MKFKFLKTTIASLVLSVSGLASAGLLNFELEWSGVSFNNNVSAVGFIVIDDTYFKNGGGNTNSSWVDDFGITVSGATDDRDNGTFGYTDYTNFSFLSNNIQLDLTLELVGQTNMNWGNYQVGERESFYIKKSIWSRSYAPYSSDHFTLRTTRSSEYMNLISFTPQNFPAVPEPSSLAIFALGMMGLASRRFNKQS